MVRESNACSHEWVISPRNNAGRHESKDVSDCVTHRRAGRHWVGAPSRDGPAHNPPPDGSAGLLVHAVTCDSTLIV